MALTVTLPPDLEAFAKREVESGRAASLEEVLAAGVRLLEARQRDEQAALDWLRFEIEKGLASGEPQPLDMEDVIGRAKARWESSAKAG